MDTSIGLSRETKAVLARWKPEQLAWDDVLRIMAASVDEKRFLTKLEAALDQMELESIDLAIQRIQAMRRSDAAALSLEQAKTRLRARRLAKRLMEFGEELADRGSAEGLQAEARQIDEELRSLVLES